MKKIYRTQLGERELTVEIGQLAQTRECICPLALRRLRRPYHSDSLPDTSPWHRILSPYR